MGEKEKAFPYVELGEVLTNPEDYTVKQLFDVIMMTHGLTIETFFDDEEELKAYKELGLEDFKAMAENTGLFITGIGLNIKAFTPPTGKILKRAALRRKLVAAGIEESFETYKAGVPMDDVMAASPGYQLLQRSQNKSS